jgi:Flp pilus assembly protein TadD
MRTVRHASTSFSLLGPAALALVTLAALAACQDEPPPSPQPPPATALPSAVAPPAGAQVPVTTSSKEALAAFLKGRDDADNTREADAIARFQEATRLDPKLAVGWAYLGYYEQGAAGEKSMQQALSLEQGLPEAERLLIDELVALRAGDNEKARVLAERVAQLSPFDWHAQLDLGTRLLTERKWTEAEQAFGKAAAFGPAAAVVYNQLGYLYLEQRRFEPAVTEFKKYAELRPNEPNTYDSIGEGLMATGKLDEAEKSFLKAAGMKFSYAWNGVAETRFLRGDWAGGMDALAKSRELATLPADKLEVDESAVWALLAQNKTDDALARVDAMEKEAKDQKLDEHYAAAPAYRAAVLLDQGKAKEAADELGKASQRLDKASGARRTMVPVQRLVLVLRAVAEARLGKAPEADKTVAELLALAKGAPAQTDYESLVAFGRGAAALAKGDRKEAIARFKECSAEDLVCRRELVLVQQLAGDKSVGDTTAEMLKINLRDPMYVYVRSRITPPK